MREQNKCSTAPTKRQSQTAPEGSNKQVGHSPACMQAIHQKPGACERNCNIVRIYIIYGSLIYTRGAPAHSESSADKSSPIPSMELCRVFCVILCISIAVTEIEAVDIPPEWRQYLEKLISGLT